MVANDDDQDEVRFTGHAVALLHFGRRRTPALWRVEQFGGPFADHPDLHEDGGDGLSGPWRIDDGDATDHAGFFEAPDAAAPRARRLDRFCRPDAAA